MRFVTKFIPGSCQCPSITSLTFELSINGNSSLLLILEFYLHPVYKVYIKIPGSSLARNAMVNLMMCCLVRTKSYYTIKSLLLFWSPVLCSVEDAILFNSFMELSS